MVIFDGPRQYDHLARAARRQRKPPRGRVNVGQRPQRPAKPADLDSQAMGTTWSYLDMTALGRQETWEDSPEGYPQTPPYKWWNWHDNYSAAARPDPKWVQVSDAGEAAFRKRDAEAKES